MKKIKFVYILILLIINIAYSQWYQQNVSAVAIGFFDSNKGIAINGPHLLTTTNGGQTWTDNPLYGTYHPNLFVLGSNHCWVITYTSHFGTYWQIRYTTDAGASWGYSLQNNENYFPVSIYFANSNVGWVVGSDGKIHKTTDGGKMWSSQTSNTYKNLRSIHFIDSLNGYVVGDNNSNLGSNIIKTTDGGATWVPLQTPTIHNLKSVYFIDTYNGWIAGEYGMLYKTTDAGQSWSFQNCGIDTISENCFNKIIFVNLHKGWLIGNLGKILYTSDGGQEWIEQQSGITSELYSIFFINELKGWIASQPILHTNNGGITAIDLDNENVFLSNLELSQNYPNPFNPSTKIRFVIPNEVRNLKDFSSQASRNDNAFVTLKVFDVLGNQIAILVNEYKPAGRYEVEFNAGNLASGIYLCIMRAGNYVSVKKMMLLK